MTSETGSRSRALGMLHAAVFLYSLSNIAGKAASGEPFLSAGFLVCYGLMILVLGLYALLWQKVLRRTRLTTAIFGKALTLLWGMLYGALFFGETITPKMILGAAIVAAGIWLAVANDA